MEHLRCTKALRLVLEIQHRGDQNPEFRSLQPVLQVLQVWFQANLPNWTIHSEHQNQRQVIS